MRAMILETPGQPLRPAELPVPRPDEHQVLLRVRACGVCRTDLHIADGELAEPKLPLIMGHMIVGEVAEAGEEVGDIAVGAHVGVPWLGWTCGECRHCLSERENLCQLAKFTGYDLDGGFAEYAVADRRYCFPLPAGFTDLQAAPLLCAGLIGFRSLRLAGDARRVGFYGFGSAAHILTQVALHQGREVYAFTKPGDEAAQSFARRLGAVWAGGSNERPPETLDAAIIFAPAGELVPAALAVTDRGGTVVCGGIHMSDIPTFPYTLLWQERILRSVANLTRQDATLFLELAPRVPIDVTVQAYPLEQANQALADLRDGRLEGSAVLLP